MITLKLAVVVILGLDVVVFLILVGDNVSIGGDGGHFGIGRNIQSIGGSLVVMKLELGWWWSCCDWSQ